MARVVWERTDGKTAYAIARDLNKDAVPTAQGARAWSQLWQSRRARPNPNGRALLGLRLPVTRTRTGPRR